MIRTTLPVLALAAAVGCGAANLYPVRATGRSHGFSRGVAHLENPELAREAKILADAQIFQLVADASAPTHVRVLELKRDFVCGNPYMLTFLTLGVVPAWIPASSVFAFVVTGPDGAELVQCRIPAYKRVSLIEWLFKPFRNDEETRGLILADAYRDTKVTDAASDPAADDRFEDRPMCLSGPVARVLP